MLARRNATTTHPCVELLAVNYSLSRGEVEQGLRERCPALLRLDASELSDRLANLHRYGVSHESMVKLVREANEESVLVRSSKSFDAAVNRLLSHTMFTSADVKRLLLSAPNVFADGEWAETVRKVNYLQFEMGEVDEVAVAHSGVLRHSLRHIRERHLFLYRRGKFLQADRHKYSNEFNPDIGSILDSTPSKFCRSLALALPQEFELFRRLLAHEDEIEAALVHQVGTADDDDFDDDDSSHPKNQFANSLIESL